jgi:cytochrome oxidase Cu insertion factor (SCO1/SenC/PrrC family)
LANRLRSRPLAIVAESGPAFVQIRWKYLQHTAPLELKLPTGSNFRLQELSGHPIAVNFFYSTCPTICRQLNGQVGRLAEQFKNEDITFVSITVDPENDTPERLASYADSFHADPHQWKFLTGPMSEVQLFADRTFRVKLERMTHTEKIFLIDRWGRFRDQFDWNVPAEMNRFAQVARTVIRETEPPIDAKVTTRNLMAGIPHTQEVAPAWLDEFFLTQPNGQIFFSRDLIGEVWIGSIFFSSCTTHCLEQNRYLRDLQDRLGNRPVQIVSVTTDPAVDTPARLQQYAQEIKAKPRRWIFLTGSDKAYLDRVAAEFFGLFVQGSDHATDLAVVDRWGKVRGKFNWRAPEQEAAMFKLIDELVREKQPPRANPDAAPRDPQLPTTQQQQSP